MSNENHPQFEKDLAGAAAPSGVDGETVERINDPARSLKLGLAKLYESYSIQIKRQLANGLIDENKANGLTSRIDNLSLADLDCEISKGLSIELAKEIMGVEMFFGPDEVVKVGIEIKEEIPPVPFTSDELERAKELGQMLIYRTNSIMKELNDTFSPKLKVEGRGPLLLETDWFKNEGFFNKVRIQPGWALVSKELTPRSTKKNYLEQSILLSNYLVSVVFEGKPLPREYQEAIDQLNTQNRTIQQLLFRKDPEGRRQTVRMLADLKINQLFRQSPAEVIYDHLVYLLNTGKLLHEEDYTWTSQDADIDLVAAGNTDNFVDIDGYLSDYNGRYLGVSFCRRGADLKS